MYIIHNGKTVTKFFNGNPTNLNPAGVTYDKTTAYKFSCFKNACAFAVRLGYFVERI